MQVKYSQNFLPPKSMRSNLDCSLHLPQCKFKTPSEPKIFSCKTETHHDTPDQLTYRLVPLKLSDDIIYVQWSLLSSSGVDDSTPASQIGVVTWKFMPFRNKNEQKHHLFQQIRIVNFLPLPIHWWSKSMCREIFGSTSTSFARHISCLIITQQHAATGICWWLIRCIHSSWTVFFE